VNKLYGQAFAAVYVEPAQGRRVHIAAAITNRLRTPGRRCPITVLEGSYVPPDLD